MTQLKITRDIPGTRPLVSLTAFTSGSGDAPYGHVPTATGSNGGVAWGSNVARISAGGSNVLGPFVNFAAGSNVTLTIDQVGSVASNTIRIHSTGAPSFGSNSNQVSLANAPGASPDSSRADHVHLGVTSLAHSSNTFSGPVTLTASGVLGITSPSAGTFNLSATGGSSSGLLDQGTFTYLDAVGAAAPGTPATGRARIYAKTDGRIYSKDGAGVEYGPFSSSGGSPVAPPTIVQQKQAGTAISSLTMDSAPTNGNVVILHCNGANTADPTAVSSTNTTWTKVLSSASAGAKYSLWVGKVSGGAGGAVITITHTNAYMTARAMELALTLTPTLVSSANGTTTASMSGATVGNLIVVAGGPDDTSQSPAITTEGQTTGTLWSNGTYQAISSIIVGYASTTTIPIVSRAGATTNKILIAQLT